MSRPKGVCCPRCGTRAKCAYKRSRPAPGLRRRYFECAKCKVRFRTTERLDPPRKK